MLVGIKSDHHMITDQVPVIFSSPVQGTLYVFLIQIIWLPSIIHVSVYYIILYIMYCASTVYAYVVIENSTHVVCMTITNVLLYTIPLLHCCPPICETLESTLFLCLYNRD